jgi:hypothetical protein
MTFNEHSLQQYDFQPFPKMARLSRRIVITEKIDGTNAQVFISEDLTTVLAGSRNRWITPDNDNYGFARWVEDHRNELLQLGPGRHFGEWWGSGVQRGYGLPKGEKRFSLFNTVRWAKQGELPRQYPTVNPNIFKTQDALPPCCDTVPVINEGIWQPQDMADAIEDSLWQLKRYGSQASPGFMNPEGIVIFHTAANFAFKKTIEKDEAPKGQGNCPSTIENPA